MKNIRYGLIAFCLLLALNVSAQGAPDAIDDALADLNERLGTSLTLNDFFWTWSQQSYETGSLGCAEPVDANVEVLPTDPAIAYQFIFSYDGNEYDYRVSTNRAVVILCSVTDLENPEDAIPTPASVIGEDDDAPYSNPLCPPPPEGIVFQQTRLAVDTEAWVTPGLPLNMRAQPDVSASIVAELPGETVFDVISGPTCTIDAFIWWQVSVDGLTGWVAEGRQEEYFIAPLPGNELTAFSSVITVENAPSLGQVSLLQGNLGWQIAFAADDSALVIPGAIGSEGLMIYDTIDMADGVRTIPGAAVLTTVDFATAPDLAVLGSAQGTLRFWDIDPDAVLIERAFLVGHDSPITAMDFSPDGSTVASSGGMAFLREDREDNLDAIAVWDVDSVSQREGLRGHTDTVTGLAFTRVGTRLLSTSVDGTLRLWDVTTATGEILYDANVAINDMAYAEDSGRIALGLANGDVILLSLDESGALNGEITLLAHRGMVNAVAFNPAGTLLFTAGDDTTIQVWDATAALGGETETPLLTLTGHNDNISDLQVSHNGVILASISDDDTVRLWAVSLNVG